MEIKLLIFDLDDTLISYGGDLTKNLWEEACKMTLDERQSLLDYHVLTREILKENDKVWNDETIRPKGNFIFKNIRLDIVNRALYNLRTVDQDLSKALVKNYGKLKDDRIYLFSDVKDTLKMLKARGYKLALLTNGSSYVQRDKIRKFGLDEFFDEIFIDGEIGVGKPEKEAYFKVIKHFGVVPEESLIIGNNHLHEVEVPNSLGLKTCYVNKEDEVSSVANYTIKNINELLDILK